MKRLVIINILLMIALTVLPKESKAETIATIQENGKVQTIASRSLEQSRQEIQIEEPVPTDISEEGIEFIKQYEGFIPIATRLTGEEYMTLGYRSLW